jgi:transposase-like protein
MGRKPRVDRTPKEKWQIIQEGMKSGNVSETCRRNGIAQTLYYRISLPLSSAFLHQALLP